MNKILLQLDSDPFASAFDSIVAYDAGVDRLLRYDRVTPESVKPLIEGAIFTRPPSAKQNTAIFIGGSDLGQGEVLLKAVQSHFFPGFSVSVMLDSNGSNTTAVAAVVKLQQSGLSKTDKVVVLAGTGPVGMRVAALLARLGCRVSLTSRRFERAQAAVRAIEQRFKVKVEPLVAADHAARAQAIKHANAVVATGATGIALLSEDAWQDQSSLHYLLDANATPPLGIDGLDMLDKNAVHHGKQCWGAIGFGGFKLKLQQAALRRLFTDTQQVLDAESLYQLALTLN